MKNIDNLVQDLERSLLVMDKHACEELIKTVIHSYSVDEILGDLFVKTLGKIGQGWEDGTYSLSQVYMSGRICEELIDKVLPAAQIHLKSQPKTAICVLSDYHLLGKRIIYSSLRASGFDLLDFGHGLQVDDLVKNTIENEIKILMISTLMLPSALKIKSLKEKLINTDVKIVVGGAPFFFDQNLWKEVGADAVGFNGKDALDIINRYS
jgi:methanogenic corrinoid protein MtbC1